MPPPKASKKSTRFDVTNILEYIRNRVSGKEAYVATEDDPNPASARSFKDRRVLPYFVHDNTIHYLFDPLNPVKMVCVLCGTTMSSYGNSSNHHGMDKKTGEEKTESQCALSKNGGKGIIKIPFVWMPQTIGPALQLGVTDKNPIKNEPLKVVAKSDQDLKPAAKTDLESPSKTDCDSDFEQDVISGPVLEKNGVPPPVLKPVAKLQAKTQPRRTSRKIKRNVKYGVLPPTKKNK